MKILILTLFFTFCTNDKRVQEIEEECIDKPDGTTECVDDEETK